MRHIPKPSPALAISILALLVATATGAGAAGVVPLAKRALLADNAKKLGGQTAAQIVASVPAPQIKAAGLVTVKSQAYSLNPTQGNDYTTTCDAGQKAIGGGVDEATGAAITFDTRPSVDGQSWRLYLANISSTAASAGTVYAICLT